MGIYDRISIQTASENRISANLFHSAFVLYREGRFTATQIKNKFNNRLASPLTVAEETDIDSIVGVIDAALTVADKNAYTDVIRAAAIAVEEADVLETAFLNILGL